MEISDDKVLGEIYKGLEDSKEEISKSSEYTHNLGKASDPMEISDDKFLDEVDDGVESSESMEILDDEVLDEIYKGIEEVKKEINEPIKSETASGNNDIRSKYNNLNIDEDFEKMDIEKYKPKVVVINRELYFKEEGEKIYTNNKVVFSTSKYFKILFAKIEFIVPNGVEFVHNLNDKSEILVDVEKHVYGVKDFGNFDIRYDTAEFSIGSVTKFKESFYEIPFNVEVVYTDLNQKKHYYSTKDNIKVRVKGESTVTKVATNTAMIVGICVPIVSSIIIPVLYRRRKRKERAIRREFELVQGRLKEQEESEKLRRMILNN